MARAKKSSDVAEDADSPQWVELDPAKLKFNHKYVVGSANTQEIAEVKFLPNGVFYTMRGFLLGWMPTHVLNIGTIPVIKEEILESETAPSDGDSR